MISNPLVSIIINCYNSDLYLKEAIDSVISQDYDNWEIVFWDNQSTDNSAAIVKSYNEPRIKYYYASEHTTLGEARNLALEKVSGELVSFLDADDYYLPKKISMTVELFTDGKVGLVYTNGFRLFQEQQRTTRFYSSEQPKGHVFNKWIENYNVMIPSVMFRKSLLEIYNYKFDSEFSMVEEYDFFLRLASSIHVGFIHEPLCVWRSHEGSLSWSKQLLWIPEKESLRRKMLDFSPNLRGSKELEAFDMNLAKDAYIYNRMNGVKISIQDVARYKFKNVNYFLLFICSYFPDFLFKKIVRFKWGKA